MTSMAKSLTGAPPTDVSSWKSINWTQVEKQVKRLHSLIQEAETNLAAVKELLISIIGDDGSVITPKSGTNEEVGGKIVEGVFDGQKMAGPDGKEYPVFEVEISSASHPFYTGEGRIVDTAGRVERFRSRVAAAKTKKSTADKAKTVSEK